MSFIPSKLGLRTHPLTQINLALVRVAGGRRYMHSLQFSCSAWITARLPEQDDQVTKDTLFCSWRALRRTISSALYRTENHTSLVPWLSPRAAVSWGSPLTPAGLRKDHQHPPLTGLDRKHPVWARAFLALMKERVVLMDRRQSSSTRQPKLNYWSIKPSSRDGKTVSRMSVAVYHDPQLFLENVNNTLDLLAARVWNLPWTFLFSNGLVSFTPLLFPFHTGFLCKWLWLPLWVQPADRLTHKEKKETMNGWMLSFCWKE